MPVKSFPVCVAWMAIGTLVLPLPLVNGMVGGIIGGQRAGDARRALRAALWASFIIVPGLAFILSGLFGPTMGLEATLIWQGSTLVTLLLGALVSGAAHAQDPTRAPREGGAALPSA